LILTERLLQNSDLKLSTQKATKTYVDGKTSGRTKKYVGTITAATTQSITAATHGCGTDVVVAIYETISTIRYAVEADILSTLPAMLPGLRQHRSLARLLS